MEMEKEWDSFVSFWFDNWFRGGRLFDIRGRRGAIELGIPLQATVQQAAENQRGNRRHRTEQLNDIERELNLIRSGALRDGEDSLLWRHGPDKFLPKFSTKSTWEQIRSKREKVSWWRGIWFKNSIPKHAFLSWIACHNRLSTFDRISKWNPSINPSCKLCSTDPESRDHIYFQCSYSGQVWKDLALKLMGHHFTNRWHMLIKLLTAKVLNKETQFLFRLTFQVSLYHIWRERNKRNHDNINTPQRSLTNEIERMMRNKIESLKNQDDQSHELILNTWINTRRRCRS